MVPEKIVHVNKIFYSRDRGCIGGSNLLYGLQSKGREAAVFFLRYLEIAKTEWGVCFSVGIPFSGPACRHVASGWKREGSFGELFSYSQSLAMPVWNTCSFFSEKNALGGRLSEGFEKNLLAAIRLQGTGAQVSGTCVSHMPELINGMGNEKELKEKIIYLFNPRFKEKELIRKNSLVRFSAQGYCRELHRAYDEKYSITATGRYAYRYY